MARLRATQANNREQENAVVVIDEDENAIGNRTGRNRQTSGVKRRNATVSPRENGKNIDENSHAAGAPASSTAETGAAPAPASATTRDANSNSSAVEGFVRGSVRRIEVHNFMTYTHCVVTPGPKLNLILGPNGSGKSSLVCALCIGLGGSTKLLGRADKPGEFVKRGCDTGSVQINLFSGEPNRDVVVYRKIKKDNSSEWKLNGVSTTTKKVDEMMKRYHVQLDNLTQFLPQDKVSSFAQMDGIQLLHATEQSLSDRSLYERHLRLIEMRNSIKGLEVSVSNFDNELEQLRQLNAALERDVERFQQREKLREEAAAMRRKLPWIKFWDCEKHRDIAKVNLDAKRARLDEKKRELRELEAPIKSAKDNAARLKRSFQRTQELARKADVEYAKKEQEIEKCYTEIENASMELESIDKKFKEYTRKVAKLEHEVQQTQVEIDALPQIDEEPEELATLRREMGKLDRQHRTLMHELSDARSDMRHPTMVIDQLKQKLGRLSDAKLQRLRKVSQVTSSDIVSATKFVDECKHAGKLRGHVYGPLACEVHVKCREHAKYLEQHVPRWCWNMFVTTNEDDHGVLAQGLKSFRVNISTYTGDTEEKIVHVNGDASTYSQYGISHTLDEIFDAPNIVKHILKDNAQIHRAYVGNATTDQRIDDFRNDKACADVDRVYTPVSMYNKMSSRYSAQVSWSVSEIRPAQMLDDDRNNAGKEELEAQIREQEHAVALLRDKEAELERRRRPIQSEMDDVQARIGTIDRERRDLKRQHHQLRSKLSAKKTMLQSTKKNPISTSQKSKLRVALCDATSKFVGVVSDVAIRLQKASNLQRDEFEAGLAHDEMHHQYRRLAGGLDEHLAQKEMLAEHVAQLSELLKFEEMKMAEAKTEAEGLTGPMTDELKAEFDRMPSTEVDLEEEVNDLLDKANNVMCQNENVMSEYETRCKRISELERTFTGESSRLSSARQRIENEKKEWLPALKELIGGINENFSVKFAQVGCAGEVRLHEADDDAFDKFEIVIMVKFRDNEDLSQLGTTRQSGGERSVSTIMYLLSLQALTVCPFRVVDEINQGMDPTNERRMFQQMVEAATQPGTPQSFILTPKLLPNLEYSKDVTILFIFCGPWLSEVSALWNGPARKKLKASQSVR